jgi:transcriptional regulator with XRE-family HTH domain
MDIGSLLRDARLAAGLTQAELARAGGTSQATLSAYEGGAKVPSAETLARVLAAAGARLTTQPASRRVITPTKDDLERRGDVLSRVIDLAGRLPVRHSPTLRYPPLRSTLGGK